MRSTANQAANVAGSKIANLFNRHVWDHVLDLDEMLWWRNREVDTNGNIIVPFKLGAIPLGIAAIVVMWLLNLLTDWAGTYGTFWPIVGNVAFFASFLIGFGGYFAIWRQVAKPKNIRFGAFIFATFNALQWKNPVTGAVTGAGTVLSLTGVIGLYYLFTALVLWTWGFSNSPMAFWIAIAAIIILASLGAASGVRTLVMVTYAAVVLIMALWSTFSGVYHGEAFDPETGAALHMVSPSTGEIDSLGRTPEECAATPNGCYSESTGEKLVPMTMDQALIRNPGGLAHSAITGISNIDIDLPDVSMGDLGSSAGGSHCSLDTPCVATVGYVLTLTADMPLTFRLSNGLEDRGLEVMVTDAKLRATVHDSELFKVTQQLGTQIFTITAEPSFAEHVESGALVLKLYPNGQGEEMVRQDYGIYVDMTPAPQ